MASETGRSDAFLPFKIDPVNERTNSKASLRCAVYTRVSTEHGLEQEFNSLDNQWEASEAYIKS
jgi:hypothetical protein